MTDEPQTWVADLARGFGWGMGLLLYRPAHRAFSTRKVPYKPSWAAMLMAMLLGMMVSLVAAAVLTVGGAVFEGIISVGQKTYVGSHKSSVSQVRSFEHGRFLVSVSHNRGGETLDKDDFSIRFWDHKADKAHRVLVGNTDEVLDIREDEHTHPPELISVGKDNTIRWWNVEHSMEEEEKRQTVSPILPFRAKLARIHHERMLVVIAGENGGLIFYDGDKEKHAITKIVSPDGDIVGLEWAEGARVVALTQQGRLRLVPSEIQWDEVALGIHVGANCLAVSSNHRFAATGDNTGVIKIWDLEAGTLLQTLASRAMPIKCLAVSDDAARVLYGTADNDVCLEDTRTDKNIAKFQHPGVPTCVRFLKYWHIASGGGDGGIRVFRVPR